MKTLYQYSLFASLCLAVQFSAAQDLLISQRDDTLNCKITDVDREYIYFTFKDGNDVQKTLMKRSDVKEFRYGFFDQPILTEEDIPEQFKYRLSGGGGFGWLTAETKNSGSLSSYVEELKSGYSIDLDAAFFLSEQYALGAKFMSFFSGNSLNNISVTYNDGTTRYGNIEDNIGIYFFGPSFYSISHLSADKKISLASSVCLGYVSYANDATVIDPMEIRGSTVGFAASIGIDILSSSNIGFGVDLSILGASIDEYDVSLNGTTQTVTPPEKDNISRIDLTFGLKFYK